MGERGIENSVEIETIMSFEEKGLKLIDTIDFFWTNEGNIWFLDLVKVGGEKETEKGEKQGKTHVPSLGYGRVTRGKWVSRVTVEGFGEDVSLLAGKKFFRPPTAAWPRVGSVEANSSSIVRKY